MLPRSKARPIDAGHVCPRCGGCCEVLEEYRPQDGGAVLAFRKIECRCLCAYRSIEYVEE